MVLLEMNANYVSFVGSCVWVGQHAAKRLRLQHLASVQAIPVLSKCVSTGSERTDALLRLLYCMSGVLCQCESGYDGIRGAT